MSGPRLPLPARLPQRVAVYVLGIMFIALGVAFSINSDLGISTVSSLPYVVSLVSCWPLSLCVTGVFCAAILLQVLLLRRQFQPVQLCQVLVATLFGALVDLFSALLGDFCLPGYGGRLVMTLIGVVLIALGVTVYVEAALVPMPMEGLALALSRKCRHVPFHRAKIMVDCFLVGSSVALSLAAFGGLEGVREGTILSALLVAPLIPHIRRVVKPGICRLCYPKCVTETAE